LSVLLTVLRKLGTGFKKTETRAPTIARRKRGVALLLRYERNIRVETRLTRAVIRKWGKPINPGKHKLEPLVGTGKDPLEKNPFRIHRHC
jgi:hypothetical protein